MERREFVVSSLGVLSTTPGCLSGSDGSSGDSEPSGVRLSSEDVTSGDPDFSLIIEYTGEVMNEVRTEGGVRTPGEGEKFLMVRTRITNVGGSERTLTSRQYVLEVGDEKYEPVLTDSEGYIGNDVLPPGVQTDGWLLFMIPRETTEATLTASQDELEEEFSVEFSRNPGIEGIID